MASSMVSSAALAPSTAPAPRLRRAWWHPSANDITSIASNGGRVQCMQVWPPIGLKKFEALSYLPPLSAESLAKEADYLLRNNWVPTLEFELEVDATGRYDGRYWTMWKLPLFGCTEELEEAKTPYPESFIRIIGFDNIRQTQCVSFIAYKPPGF